MPNALANPTLELRDSNGALLIANNDWQDNPAQAAEITAAGLAPTNNLEAAIAATLPPGLYTALLAGLNNGTGIGLVEVYDRGDGSRSHRRRHSRRARLPTPTPSPSPTPTTTPTPPPPGFCTENFDGVTRPRFARGLGGDKCRRPDPLWITSSTTPDTRA